MNFVNDISLFLPKYLSEESTKKLLHSIGGFPDNISHTLYTNSLTDDNIIFQGDALKSLPITNLPEEKIGFAPSLIISNTCDIDLSNIRPFQSQICYAPILRLDKYENMLKMSKKYREEESRLQHLEKLRKQHITQVLYLPIGGGLEYEGVVFLDRIVNCHNKSISREHLSKKRLFSLSNYGHYLLLMKLSIHFCRIQEKVDRDLGRLL